MLNTIRHKTAPIAARGFSLVLNLALAIVVARLVGPAVSGAFFLAYATANLAGMIGRSGTEVWAIKTLPTMYHNGQGADFLQELTSLRRKCWFGSGTAAAILAIFAAVLLLNDHENTFATSLLYVAPSVPIVSAAILNSAALRAANRISLGAFAEVGMSQGLVIAALLAFSLFVDIPATLPAALYTMATTTTWAFSQHWVRRAVPTPIAPPAKASRMERSQRLAMLHMMTSGVLFFLMTSLPLFILGITSTSHEVGIYNAATRAATVLAIIPALQVTYLVPRISRAMGENKIDEANAHLRMAARQASAVMLVALIVILVGADRIMSVFGEDFSTGSGVLVTLAVGQAFVIVLGNVNPIMSLVGLERASARIMAALILIAIVPMGVAAHEFGAGGLALAYVGAMAGYSIACNVLLRKRVGISCQLN